MPAGRGERLAAVGEWLAVGPPRCYSIVPYREGGKLAARPGPTGDEERRRRTRGGRIAGSQTGSHRRQTSGDARPRLAVIGAAKRPARPHRTPSRDRQNPPSKQRVAGSNPARRTSPKPRPAATPVGWYLIFMKPSGASVLRRGVAVALPLPRTSFLPQEHSAGLILALTKLRCPWP